MSVGEFLFLLKGLQWTLALSAIGFVCGGVAGLAVALARTSSSSIMERTTASYIAVFQGTPLLMQLFVVYYGLALIGSSPETPACPRCGSTVGKLRRRVAVKFR